MGELAGHRSPFSMADLAPDALSVAELTGRIKDLLEGTFPSTRVRGEVIGLTRARSGHLYFTLKDDTGADAQVSVVVWRTRAARLRFRPEDGLRVVVHGRIAVYEPRGVYQLVADSVLPAGRGTLLVALERLRERLWSEGLFDPARKRPLPFAPARIGLITSPSGAALHDVLRSIYRKFPAWVRILPVRVQGEGAAEDLVRAFGFLERHPEVVDVVIVARGGGSLEDLWTFNEERVVRAVAGSRIPTICGVGHEVDVTLCDLAADVRAQTPTHAGELVVPDLERVWEVTTRARQGLETAFGRRLEAAWRDVRHAGQVLSLRSPSATLERFEVSVTALGRALEKGLYNRFRQWQDQVSLEGEKLHALSPLGVLKRGYSLVVNPRGAIVRSAREVQAGDRLGVVLGEGELDVRVLEGRDAPTSLVPGRSARSDGRTE